MAVLAFLILAAAALVIWAARRRTPTTRTDFPDYKALVAQYLPGMTIRYPTDEELRRFPTLWPTMGPDENAVTDYLKAISLLPTVPPPAGSTSSEAAYAGNAAAFGQWIQANQPALDALREAVRRPDFGLPVFVNPADGTPMTDFDFTDQMRGLARLCHDAGFQAELDGRPDDAAQWYLASMRMGRHMRRGTLVQNLFSIALSAVGNEPLSRLIANAPLKDDTLNDVISFCDDEPPVADEITAVLNAEEEWFDAHPASVRLATAALTGQRGAIRSARKDFALPLSEVAQLKDAQDLLARNSGASGPTAALWGWRGAIAMRQVRMEALKTRAAIALYAKQQGKLPERLDDLVPDMLPEIPPDPFTGAPLLYRLTGKRWELRSAGPDLQMSPDEGPTHSQLLGHFWQWDVHSGGSTGADDYIFVSDLDSNIDARKRLSPKADARWEELHPTPRSREGAGPGRPRPRKPGADSTGP